MTTMTNVTQTNNCQWLEVHETEDGVLAFVHFDEHDKKKSVEGHQSIRFVINDNERAAEIKELAKQPSEDFSTFYQQFVEVFHG